MSKSTTLAVCVYRVLRDGASAEGNPFYMFFTDHGNYRTEKNSGAAYGLENDFSIGDVLDVDVVLTLTGRGSVKDWKLV